MQTPERDNTSGLSRHRLFQHASTYRSMSAGCDHPHRLNTQIHLIPRTSFMSLVNGSNSALSSSIFFFSSLSCVLHICFANAEMDSGHCAVTPVLVIDVETLLRGALKFLAIELLQLLSSIPGQPGKHLSYCIFVSQVLGVTIFWFWIQASFVVLFGWWDICIIHVVED